MVGVGKVHGSGVLEYRSSRMGSGRFEESSHYSSDFCKTVGVVEDVMEAGGGRSRGNGVYYYVELGTNLFPGNFSYKLSAYRP